MGVVSGFMSVLVLYLNSPEVRIDKHFRVNHGNNEFARGKHHVNGVESFWNFAKRRLAQFNGIAKHTL